MITIPAQGCLPRLNLGQARSEYTAIQGRRALIALLSIVAPVRRRSRFSLKSLRSEHVIPASWLDRGRAGGVVGAVVAGQGSWSGVPGSKLAQVVPGRLGIIRMVGELEYAMEIEDRVADDSLSRQTDSPVQVALGVVGPHDHHLIEVCQSGIDVSLLATDPTTMKERERMLRVAVQGPIEVCQGFLNLSGRLVEAAAVEKRISQVG
jgi:hypothetical protein